MGKFYVYETHSEETRRKLSEKSKADWARRKALKLANAAEKQHGHEDVVSEKLEGNQ